MKQQEYKFTLEIFRAWPDPKVYCRVHRGGFEENRDNLSPGMIHAKEVVYHHQFCTPRKDQKKLAKQFSAMMMYFC